MASRASPDGVLRFGLERNAVSGGDVWMLDERSGVLASGDLVTLPAPLLDTACAQGWSEALRRLEALAFTRLVPGHGAPMSHAQFTRYRHAFDRLLACAASDAAASACRDGWMQDGGRHGPANGRGAGVVAARLLHRAGAARARIATFALLP